MRREVARCLGIALAVGIGVASPPGNSTLAGVPAGDDPQAWAELVAAYKKLHALSGYRVRVDSPSEQLSAVYEVIPGKAIHRVIQEPGLTLETVTVGRDSRYRFIVKGKSGSWACDAKPLTSEPEPSSVPGPVKTSRGAETTIGAAMVRTYTYPWQVLVESKYITRTTTVYVGQQTGLPRRSISPLVRGDYILDYYDYGAHIEISLPHC